MKLYDFGLTALLIVCFISATTTLAVETNNPEVSEFGDKYLKSE